MYKKYFKRPLDIIMALCGIIVLSPVMLITAILVAVKLGLPVFYCQERAGKNGKLFNVVKFRSMSSETDENGKLLPGYMRLTKFGEILRASSLDELPELWNILIGNMSVVGPRPLPTIYLDYYTEEESKRHEVRGGLTGLAQINGRNLITWEEKFKYDVEYVENITFLNDMKIIFKTAYKVFARKDVKHESEVVINGKEIQSLNIERKDKVGV